MSEVLFDCPFCYTSESKDYLFMSDRGREIFKSHWRELNTRKNQLGRMYPGISPEELQLRLGNEGFFITLDPNNPGLHSIISFPGIMIKLLHKRQVTVGFFHKSYGTAIFMKSPNTDTILN